MTFNPGCYRRVLLSGMLLCSSGQAATHVSIHVKGHIKPASCDISLEGNGVLDWGNIASQNLSRSRATTLSPKRIRLNVSCDSPALIAVRGRDMLSFRHGAGSDRFSLGTPSAAVQVGSYRVSSQVLSGSADGGKIVAMLASDDGGKTWQPSSQGWPFLPDGSRYLSVSKDDSGLPSVVSVLQMGLDVAPDIRPLRDLTAGETVELAGRAVFDIVYL